MTKTNLEHSFNVVIPAKEFEAKQNVKLEEIKKEAKIAGFRPGQAPISLIKSKYGSAVKGEVLDDLIQIYTDKTLTDNKIKPALRPKVEITKFDDGADIEFKIDAESLPEIKPIDFKTLTIEKITTKAAEKDVQAALDKLASSRKTTEIVNEKRATKTGDVIVIDFKGTIDGAEFKGGTGKDYYLDLGSRTFIPGFEEQLTGHKTGDTVDVNITFPENYHTKNLAGKKAVFKVDIKELRRYKTPSIDDELAKTFGAESLDGLKKTIETELNKEYEQTARFFTKRSLLDALAATHSFEVPPSMVEMEFNAIWKQLEEAKKQNRLDEDEKTKSDDELKKEYHNIAERRVRLGLLLAEVANENKITLSESDLNQAVMTEARRYPGQEKAVFEYYQKNKQALETLKAPLFEEKVVDYILGLVKINEKVLSPEELYVYNPDEKTKKQSKG